MGTAPPELSVEAAAGVPTTVAPRPPLWQRLWFMLQFVTSVAVTVGVLVYLLQPQPVPPRVAPLAAETSSVVTVVGPRLIRIQAGTPFDRNLQRVVVQRRSISDPVLTVTGRVVASLRPGKGKGNDFWQFDAPEVLTIFNDWQKAQADIAFAETQLILTQKLAAARLEAQKQVVARLEKLVSAGTDTLKDLATEKANLLQVDLQGRKEVHEAETAVRLARRTEATLARQLQQLGLDPDLLRTATSDIDIVQADVPEGWLHRVRIGQGCRAVFFGIPQETFTGRVNSIAPVLSRERRSLRVLFVIDDPHDKLRPGMFAEIGLGTDPRHTLLIPADAVLHVGRSDYVLVAAGDDTWRVTEVQVGEPHQGEGEILEGLREGEQILGKGAILLKPAVVQALWERQWTATEEQP
ncbi:MAG: efflux RND transporter periplasmic adaptor subunit [Gemmataceae bacterium]|nr:efflux RND transporter periplasmic adaptor subunit [Gemmataceae bacterium]